MKKARVSQLLTSMRTAQGVMSRMSANQKSTLEKMWDIEHAYYSSVLEGSKMDRKEFDELAKQVA